MFTCCWQILAASRRDGQIAHGFWVEFNVGFLSRAKGMDFFCFSSFFGLQCGYTRPGKRVHNYGKSPFFMGKATISMAIFNSYVKLPEDKPIYDHDFQ